MFSEGVKRDSGMKWAMCLCLRYKLLKIGVFVEAFKRCYQKVVSNQCGVEI